MYNFDTPLMNWLRDNSDLDIDLDTGHYKFKTREGADPHEFVDLFVNAVKERIRMPALPQDVDYMVVYAATRCIRMGLRILHVGEALGVWAVDGEGAIQEAILSEEYVPQDSVTMRVNPPYYRAPDTFVIPHDGTDYVAECTRLMSLPRHELEAEVAEISKETIERLSEGMSIGDSALMLQYGAAQMSRRDLALVALQVKCLSTVPLERSLDQIVYPPDLEYLFFISPDRKSMEWMLERGVEEYANNDRAIQRAGLDTLGAQRVNAMREEMQKHKEDLATEVMAKKRVPVDMNELASDVMNKYPVLSMELMDKVFMAVSIALVREDPPSREEWVPCIEQVYSKMFRGESLSALSRALTN